MGEWPGGGGTGSASPRHKETRMCANVERQQHNIKYKGGASAVNCPSSSSVNNSARGSASAVVNNTKIYNYQREKSKTLKAQFLNPL